MASDVSDFVIDVVFPVFFTVLFLAVVAGIVGLCVDGIQSRRAFAATTACEAKQSIPRRKTFSTEVVCIPSIARQDTTTVKLEQIAK